MSIENFSIEDFEIEAAQDVCKFIESADLRNYAVSNALAPVIAAKGFESINADIDTKSGLHNICRAIEEAEISDIYINGTYIDVRLYFNENELCVPKKHFDNNITPLAYMFVKVNEDLDNGCITGFILSNEVDTTNDVSGYYPVKEEDLVSYYDIEPYISGTAELSLTEDLEKKIFNYLDNTSENDFGLYKELIKSKEARELLISAYNAQMAFNYVSFNDTDPNEEDVVGDTEETDAEASPLDIIYNNDNLDIVTPIEEIAPAADDFQIQDFEPQDLEEYSQAEEIEQIGDIEPVEQIELADNFVDEPLSNLEGNNNEDLSIGDQSEDTFNDGFSDELISSEDEYSENNDIEEEENDENINDVDPFENKSEDDLNEHTQEFEEFNYEPETSGDTSVIENTEVLEYTTDDASNPDETEVASEYEEVESPAAEDEQDSFSEVIEEYETYTEPLQTIEYSTETTPSINEIENSKTESEKDDLLNSLENSDNTTVEQNITNGDGASQEQDGAPIGDLFSDAASQEMDEVIAPEPVKKKRSIIPLLGAVVIIGAAGYYGYSKYTEMQSIPPVQPQEIPAENTTNENKTTQEAMPVETVENIKQTDKENEVGNAVSIPAIENNLDASILVSNLSVSWEVPAGYVTNASAKRYFTKLGKIIQLNLKTELLLLSKPPITNKIVVEIEFDKGKQSFVIKEITASSGEKTIDDVIYNTVKSALDMSLTTNPSVFNNIQGNPLLIINL